MNDWTTIKKDFFIEKLYDIFAFIEKQYFSNDDSYTIAEYANLIKTTNLTPDMFKGDKAIFKGFKEKKEKGSLIEYSFYNKTVRVLFYKPFDSGVIKIEMFCVKENGWEVYNNEFIKTLSDFAELTKDTPCELC